MPQTGTPNFEIGPEDMEIGMGIHGEPGMRRVPLASADAVVDILMEPILAELELHNGDSVAVLVNGLGATTQLELFVLFRRVHNILQNKGIHIHARWVGEYATSLEMAGASVTILKLDDTLTRLLDHPCRTPALTVAMEPAPLASAKRSVLQVQVKKAAVRRDPVLLRTTGSVTPARFRVMMANVAATIREKRDWLSELDGIIGDGDHGVTMDIGWTAVSAALSELEANATISETCDVIAQAFLTAVGASSGPLYASAFQSAGAAVSDRLNLDGPAMAAWVKGMGDGILSRGGARPGDKTMLDAWVPAGDAAVTAAGNGADEYAALQAATDAARAGRDETATFESRRGRSAKLGARSLGHIDPGAASAALMLAAMLET